MENDSRNKHLTKNIMIIALQTFPKIYKGINTTKYSITKWHPSDAHNLFKLEEKVWAPWLRKPEKNFATIAKIFPQGQRKITNKRGEIIAFITTNRVNWDGDPASLNTWDSVAGGSIESSDYSKTFIPSGNTLSLMSITVDPVMRGKGLASKLVKEVIDIAKNLEIKHLNCSISPSNYGNFKLEPGNESTEFEDYCKIATSDGLPIDPWLRVVTKQGMLPLRVEEKSMEIQVSLKKFKEYRKTYNKNKWMQNKKGTWECGKTGIWTIKNNCAVYTEPNLWGEIPIY